jgi:dTDP-4-dehydrorhamnose reductase
MNVLILGGAGMLGHKMFQILRERLPDVWCTVREPLPSVSLFAEGNVLTKLDAGDWPALERLLRDRRPRVIINCVGVIKQRALAKSAVPSIAINSLLPHRLAELVAGWHGRLIHFSTDCVFSGARGNYTEADHPDARDLYGQTKALGEVNAAANALTLRTSIIGRELSQFQSLLEWFFAQAETRAPIKGYTRALYSGVTTNYLAELVATLIEHHPALHGLYQVASETISKYELLCLLARAYCLDVAIAPDDQFFCDRSMKGDKFVAATGCLTPPWPDLVEQLAQDQTPYEEWRRHVRQTV